jgi:hypothetical protein
MTTRLLAAVALAIALAFTAPAARADKDKGEKDHGNPHGNPHAAKDHDEGWEHRGDYEYHTYAKGSVPPGWSHGKKTGWGNCGLPPGQAKKYGCQTYTYQGRPYYYYQNEGGQIFVRRPVVSIYGGVDIH